MTIFVGFRVPHDFEHSHERTFSSFSVFISQPEQLFWYVPAGILAALGFLFAGAPQAHTHIMIAAITTTTLNTVLPAII